MIAHPQVWRAMVAAAERGGNPASLHQLGQATRREVDEAARWVAALVGTPEAQVVFAGSLAEAHLLAIEALWRHTAAAAAHTLLLPQRDGVFAAVNAAARTRGVVVAPWRGGPPPGAGPFVLALTAPEPWDPVLAASASALSAGAWSLDATPTLAALRARGAACVPAALPWRAQAHDTPHCIVVDARPLGGPPGLAALVAPGLPPRAGTVPRELVVGMGAAARLLAKGE